MAMPYYLTTAEAIQICRFDQSADPRRAFDKWCRRRGVTRLDRGRLVERDALLTALHDARMPRHRTRCKAMSLPEPRP